jgi:hypothetical protein
MHHQPDLFSRISVADLIRLKTRLQRAERIVADLQCNADRLEDIAKCKQIPEPYRCKLRKMAAAARADFSAATKMLDDAAG